MSEKPILDIFQNIVNVEWPVSGVGGGVHLFRIRGQGKTVTATLTAAGIEFDSEVFTLQIGEDESPNISLAGPSRRELVAAGVDLESLDFKVPVVVTYSMTAEFFDDDPGFPPELKPGAEIYIGDVSVGGHGLFPTSLTATWDVNTGEVT